MADGDTTELKLHIITDADTKGFQQLGDGTKKLTTDNADLADQTKATLGETANLSNELKKSGHAAGEAGLSHHELRKVLADIGNTIAPTAGRALGELALGPVGATLALVGLYEGIIDRLKEISDQEDKIANADANPDTGGIESLISAWQGAIKTMAAYYADMRTAGQDNDPVATQIKNIKQISDAQLEAYKKELEALEQIEEKLTAINDAKAGKSKDQTDADVQGVKDKFKAQADAADQAKKEADGSGALIEEQKRRQAQAAGLDQRARETAAAAARADAIADQKEKEFDKAHDVTFGTAKDDATGKTYQQEQTDAEAARNEALENANNPNIPLSARQAALQQTQDDLDQINRIIADYRTRFEQLKNGGLQQAEEDKTAADKDAAAAKNASTVNQDRLGKLPGEIEQAEAIEAENQRAAAATADITAATRAIVAAANAASAESLQQMQAALRQSNRVIQALAADATAAAAAHSQTLPVIQKALADIMASNAKLAAQIAQTPFNNR